ncbi:MAG: TIR domain-containing protein [Chlorobium sp.]|nr:MAG: TIR domain-containing protein [Chlorobium sp.]
MAILPDVMERCNNRVNRGFMADIFISYAREDLDRVKPIVEELKKRGWSVFFDVESIHGGANWPSVIDEALDNSHCVLVFWSFTSVDIKRHPLVWGEAEKGRNKDILVPVRIDTVDSPTGFRHIHTIDLCGCKKNSSHEALRQIIEAITPKIPPSIHTNLPSTPVAASIPEPISKPVQAERKPDIRQKTPASTTLKIGDYYGGGKVAWLDSTGKHGLIAAKADLPGGDKYTWEAAKKACKELNENGYNDWYLPSKDELNHLYTNRSAVGGFAVIGYWSSTEISADSAWRQTFGSGVQYYNFGKYDEWRVRPVRAF